jgi:hypothetical protein
MRQSGTGLGALAEVVLWVPNGDLFCADDLFTIKKEKQVPSRLWLVETRGMYVWIDPIGF